eukprot:scaffold60637_cov30-Phaeocystis_antarctica.AAC.2
MTIGSGPGSGLGSVVRVRARVRVRIRSTFVVSFGQHALRLGAQHSVGVGPHGGVPEPVAGHHAHDLRRHASRPRDARPLHLRHHRGQRLCGKQGVCPASQTISTNWPTGQGWRPP